MVGIGALLVWVLGYVLTQGLQAINWGFITDTPPGNPSDTGRWVRQRHRRQR